MYGGGLKLFGGKSFLFEIIISCKKTFMYGQISIYNCKNLEHEKLKANSISYVSYLQRTSFETIFNC